MTHSWLPVRFGQEILRAITMPSNSLKLNLSVTFVFEQNQLSMNLGETFNKFQKSVLFSLFLSFLQMILVSLN